MPLAAGNLLGPNVRVVRPLGEGSMGTVWLAENEALGSEVAVKVLHAARDDGKGRQRFTREASAAAKLDSPHVVRVFDFGHSDDDEPYIVMERLKGRDLKSVIEAEGAMSPDRVVDLVQQICRGLQHAHDAGLVHRDIKPANIFLVELDGEPFVKILDFGIAKHRVDETLDLTAPDAVMGTPYYMSPEQFVMPAEIDHRSDLWSVAVVAYAALLATLPFSGESVGALSVAVHTGDFDRPSHIDSKLSGAIDGFFSRALAIEPEDRYQSATELATRFAEAVDVAAGAETLDATTSDVDRAPLRSRPSTSPTQSASSKRGYVAAAALAAAAGAMAWLQIPASSPLNAGLEQAVEAAARHYVAPKAPRLAATLFETRSPQAPAATVAARPAPPVSASSAPASSTPASSTPVEPPAREDW